ncbi:YbaK/EbsC family protein [Microbacterium halophytorum]|uniref:YbaK/EbsC family protein n=1 Tax=Microbacterium halophytorum TaxID=2067568 RepID=UPI000CFE31AC|nr:YbaK/EbsC family protein [Microbacterium halophytorum]
MTTDAARHDLARFALDDRVIEFTESSATVELAAERLGTLPAHIAKTLAFVDPTDTARAVLVVAAGDAKVHSGGFKRRFGGKAMMIPPDRLVEMTGHPMGGVCPFANPDSATVWLDESLRRFDLVYPAAGTAASAVRLTVPELERASGAAGWVDVCKGWREEQRQHVTPQQASAS